MKRQIQTNPGVDGKAGRLRVVVCLLRATGYEEIHPANDGNRVPETQAQ